jgi:hypothetical protein
MNNNIREVLMERYTNGLTKSPMDLSDEYLVRTFQLYKSLTARSVTDEVYLSLLESEIARRREMAFNRAAIDELFETC